MPENTPDNPATQGQPPKVWALIELFGHARIAGAVTEHSFGGETFTRVDVPEVRYAATQYVDGKATNVVTTIQAHTKLLGGKSIYSLAFIDEAAAITAAQSIKHEPIKAYQLRDLIESLPIDERRLLLQSTLRDEDVPY